MTATRIGVPKGGAADSIVASPGDRRVLHWADQEREFFRLRSKAIPGLVSHGLLDQGYCGSDVLDEFPMPELLTVHDLGPYPSEHGVRMKVAAARPDVLEVPLCRPLVVGTSYPRTASRFMQPRGKAHIIVEQPGCIEGLCPSLVDLIVDVVESGRSLEANSLMVLADLGEIRLVMVRRRGQ